MSIHPIFSGILAAQGLPVADPKAALLRDLKEFLYVAGNVLCDDCHDSLSNEAGMLIKRINATMNGEV